MDYNVGLGTQDKCVMFRLIDSCGCSSQQVLGYYNRRGINPEAFLNEIKYIASDPDDKHFFNVTDEAALKDIVDALGERIFSLEGWRLYHSSTTHSIASYWEHSPKPQPVKHLHLCTALHCKSHWTKSYILYHISLIYTLCQLALCDHWNLHCSVVGNGGFFCFPVC